MPNQSPVVVASAAKGAADPRGGGGAARINKRFHGLVPDTISSGGQERDTCLVNQQSPTMMIMSSGVSNKRERNHLCGSLPNYLDDAAGEEEEDVDQLQLTDSCRGKFTLCRNRGHVNWDYCIALSLFLSRHRCTWNSK